MKQQPAITIAAWDETVSSATIARGTVLTFAIPPDLLYREIYFFVEPNHANPSNDCFLTGQVVLSHQGHLRTALPASVGSNANTLVLNKTIVSCFANQVVDRTSGAVPVVGNAVRGNVLAVLSNGFNATWTNILNMAPRYVISQADRFAYVIDDWSRLIAGVSELVTGFRAFALVISSNYPLP